MLGDGTGSFNAISADSSGIEIYGEQRGSAVSDYNRDGKPDWWSLKNGSETKLYANNGSARGISIRLEGPSENPSAIGAKLRLYKDGNPVSYRREIKAGSGYLSQSSSTQILGYSEVPDVVSIIWPNGEEMNVSMPADQSYIIIDRQGNIVN
ncbi:MAG: ASPIC/UnbV domain-containing protein [Balneolaceae bacterium]|nr:ASPIC/UnbV domain-containing protein [Balneolaceae bacterium]